MSCPCHVQKVSPLAFMLWLHCMAGRQQCCSLGCRYYITRHSLPSLNDVGLIRFRGEDDNPARIAVQC